MAIATGSRPPDWSSKAVPHCRALKRETAFPLWRMTTKAMHSSSSPTSPARCAVYLPVRSPSSPGVVVHEVVPDRSGALAFSTRQRRRPPSSLVLVKPVTAFDGRLPRPRPSFEGHRLPPRWTVPGKALDHEHLIRVRRRRWRGVGGLEGSKRDVSAEAVRAVSGAPPGRLRNSDRAGPGTDQRSECTRCTRSCRCRPRRRAPVSARSTRNWV